MFKSVKLQDLEQLAFVIKEPVEIYFKSVGRKDFLDPSTYKEKEKGFYSSEDAIAWVHEGILYTIPCLHRNIRTILVNNGFEKKDMYVPFSPCCYPYERKDEWDRLVEKYKIKDNVPKKYY